jgi:hypothetical protein
MVHYNGQVGASMQCYVKGSVGTSITLHYNGKVAAFMQCYIKGSVGPSLTVFYIS